MGYFLRLRPKNKFNNVRTGDGFPSKLEAAVYQILRLREKAGEIKDIRRQHSVDLGCQITWMVDFSYLDKKTKQRVWVEAKGMETGEYRLKLKLWRWGQGPGRLEIWKGNYRGPTMTDVIVPRKLK